MEMALDHARYEHVRERDGGAEEQRVCEQGHIRREAQRDALARIAPNSPGTEGS
ncbi:hypothetical protein ACFCWG_03035 [Streptomyces sp. NPDC056390]|uniref:hypothetical protein n=1 Tax=Streptomyces sp. NPDC056390 TaxID=3345806 RepID=UPI0035E22E15